MDSPVVDDYLKTIYQHTEWQDARITPSQLALVLGLAPSTVTEMVKKLAAHDLVTHRPYGPVSLTGPGEQRAKAIVRRHRLIETWLVREFDYSWDEVHDEAEVLEHALSERLLDRIDERLGHPEYDPHGDAIPRRDGAVPSTAFVLLGEAPTGHRGRVLRVSDRDPGLLRDIEDGGLTVGAEVEVRDPRTLRMNGADLAVAESWTRAVWLTA